MTTYSPVSTAAKAAKARRQAVLRRVQAQRAIAHKRTVADWMEEGLIVRASELRSDSRFGNRSLIGSHR
jgi:hypothetical protein